MLRGIAVLALGAVVLAGGVPARADDPRIEAFVAPPAVSNVQISPSGAHVSMVTRVDNRDVLAVFDVDNLDAAPDGIDIEDVTFQWVEWASDDRLLVNVFDGLQFYSTTYWVHLEPRYRTIAMNRDGSDQVLLFRGVQGEERRAASRSQDLSRVTDVLSGEPNHVLMPAVRGAEIDLFRVNVVNGAASRVERGRRNTLGWVTDVDGVPVVRIDADTRNSSRRYFTRAPGEQRWTQFQTVQELDRQEFWPMAAGDRPGVVYAVARPRGTERAGVYLFDTQTNAFGDPVVAHPRVDINSVLFDPMSGQYIGASYIDDRMRYIFADAELQAHFDGVDEFFGGDANIRIVDSSVDGQRYVLLVSGPDEPGSYNVYDVSQARVTRLADTHPDLRDFGNEVEVIRYRARDGLEITGYLTVPDDPAGAPPPLVVMPHGGPELRDSLDFDITAQFLASRGYAVFQPNFRGSAGYGRAFTAAGRGEWGRAMQNDITDGLMHLIEQGRVDADRVCIYGASYGGYAALAGATLTPELYQCAASRSGLSDLRAFMNWLGEEAGERSDEYVYWRRLIGDPDTDGARMDEVSPRQLAADVQAPILLMHGLSDETVPPAQAELMRDAVILAGGSARYFEFAGAEHTDWPSELEARALRELELFLAANIGGRTGPEPDYAALGAMDRGIAPRRSRGAD